MVSPRYLNRGGKLNPTTHNSRASAWATAPPLRGGLLTQNNTRPAHNIQHYRSASKTKRVTPWKTTNVYTPRGGPEADPRLIGSLKRRSRATASVWAPILRSLRSGFPRNDSPCEALGVWCGHVDYSTGVVYKICGAQGLPPIQFVTRQVVAVLRA